MVKAWLSTNHSGLRIFYFQALPHEQVVAVHVDNGFMRKSESREVEESLKRLGLRLKGNWG